MKKFINQLLLVLMLLMSMTVASCSKDNGDVKEPNSDEWGSLKNNGYAGTGEAVDIKPLMATVKCCINKDYSLAYTTIAVEYGTSSTLSDFYVEFGSGLINGDKYTVTLQDLEPNTTYYYRAYVVCGAMTYLGDIRSFTTADYTIVTSGFVEFDDVKWSATNFGASSPEQLGTRLNWNGSGLNADAFYQEYGYNLNVYNGDTVDPVTRRDPTLMAGDLNDLYGFKWIKTTYKGVKGYAILNNSGEKAIFVPFGTYGDGYGSFSYCWLNYQYTVISDNIDRNSEEVFYHYDRTNEYLSLAMYYYRPVKK